MEPWEQAKSCHDALRLDCCRAHAHESRLLIAGIGAPGLWIAVVTVAIALVVIDRTRSRHRLGSSDPGTFRATSATARPHYRSEPGAGWRLVAARGVEPRLDAYRGVGPLPNPLPRAFTGTLPAST